MKDAPTGIRILVLRTLSEIRDIAPFSLMSCLRESAVLQLWPRGLERLGLDMVYIKPEVFEKMNRLEFLKN